MTEVDDFIRAGTIGAEETASAAATVRAAGTAGAPAAVIGLVTDRSELFLMLLSDARLPTGAHTQSAGLEPAMNAGMTSSQIPAYLSARLRTVTAVEAAAAVLALSACRSDDIRGGLDRVDRSWRARTISPALRETSVLLGRGYQRLLVRLWPAHPAVIALRMLTNPARAVALGVAAACAGLSAVQLARLIGYDDAQTIAAATLKIAPLDPVDATAWVIAAHGEIEAMAAAVSGLTDLEAMPASGAPLIEKWAEIHSTTTQRLFRA